MHEKPKRTALLQARYCEHETKESHFLFITALVHEPGAGETILLPPVKSGAEDIAFLHMVLRTCPEQTRRNLTAKNDTRTLARWQTSFYLNPTSPQGSSCWGLGN